MKIIELLDLTTDVTLSIRQDGKTLYIGDVENAPYKYIRREVIAFGHGDISDISTGLIISV